MKKLLSISIFFLIVFVLPFKTYAYTMEDVSKHNTVNDCWMIYDGGVYDLTNYVESHDRYMDISSWCGEDMTKDFETKAGEGVDHRASTYTLLETYRIGDIETPSTTTTAPDTTTSSDSIDSEDEAKTYVANDTSEEEISGFGPYNLLIPLLSTSVIYWMSYIFFFKKYRKSFNGFWNTILFLSFLIPSFSFGIFMMLRYRFDNLYNIDFDFMYWHVELSVVMGVLAINHIIQRFALYMIQLGLKK